MEINYVCSFGNDCFTAELLKRNNLKNCSYPFDWVHSTFKIVVHCVSDNILNTTYSFKMKNINS